MNTQFVAGDLMGVAVPVRDYDPELDNIKAILSDICKRLEGHSTFLMSGFDDECWPVDVCTDFMVFIEQLPEGLAAIESSAAFDLDFYEQGLERWISLEPDNGRYKMTCLNSLERVVQPHVEYILAADLQKMLLTIRQNFLEATKMVGPHLLEHDWFRRWIENDTALLG